MNDQLFPKAVWTLEKKNWMKVSEMEKENRGLFVYAVLASVGLINLWHYEMGGFIKKIASRNKNRIPLDQLQNEMKDLDKLGQIYFYSKKDFPLLIIGETGTGKEFMAKAIHLMGDRRDKEYVALNCAAIPENLLESELFGYEKGAFTGAGKRKKGLLEIAEKGTLFLDEIGKMPKSLQVKLLRVIEEKNFRSLGGEKKINIDVRFVAALQPCDLPSLHRDLYWRFHKGIEMPTLRETLKTRSFAIIHNSLQRVLSKMKHTAKSLPGREAYQLLLDYDYPGNYREMESILIEAVSLSASRKNNDIWISAEDITKAMDKNNRINRLREEIPSSKVTGEYEENARNPLANLRRIKLKGIVDYAETVKASIIEAKVKDVLSTGANLKTVLIEEGFSKKEYFNFRKKVVTITGKNIKDFGS